jgi:phosphoglycolate phosphatase
MSPALPAPRAILFDLDGTLADTAPDLAAALNHLRLERGLPEASFASLRPHASAGARGLIGAGLGITPDDAEYEALRLAFLAQYERALAVHSRLFEQVPTLLQQLEARGLRWGVVTNKIARFTLPLLPQIGLQHAQCVVCGDTTPHAKPHPAPLHEAARQLDVPAAACWYVGDDLRDIEAAHAAGMASLAAAWGYCGKSAPQSWQAGAILQQPLDLLDWLDLP